VNKCKPLPVGARVHARVPRPPHQHRRQSRAVQVDPIKSSLKPPVTKRLKLEYDKLLSIFGLEFNLRRYNKAYYKKMCSELVKKNFPGRVVQVDPIKPVSKPPGTKRLKLSYDDPLSNFAFKFNMRRYTPARRTTTSCSCHATSSSGTSR